MSTKSTDPSCSVIIPAYNERNCIGSTLHSLTKEAKTGEFDVIIVCNGCSDNTAEIAREACEQARIVETPVASKTNALNIGLQEARCKMVVFLDADIKTSATSVRLLLKALIASNCDLAFGKAEFNTKNCSPAVGAFYQAWHLNPYFDGGKVGGFFAVSAAGLKRLSSFPDLTNDDEYVRRMLMANSVFVPAATYAVEPPRTLASLIKVRSRVYRGNKQLAALNVPAAHNQQHDNASRFLWRLVRNPRAWAGAFVFATVAVAAHLRNRAVKTIDRWEQDLTARAIQG